MICLSSCRRGGGRGGRRGGISTAEVRNCCNDVMRPKSMVKHDYSTCKTCTEIFRLLAARWCVHNIHRQDT